MNKKTLVSMLLLVIIICLFYTLFTMIHFQFQTVPTYCDGYWYIKVAENIAKGKGLVENVVLYHFPRIEKLKEFPHPIGNYWNPLNSIVLAGFYKIFGINEWTPKLAAFLIDLVITILIFFIGMKIFPGNLLISFFTSLIYIVHPAAIDIRSLAGLPETYTTLFMLPMVYFLYLSFTKNKSYVILASIFGGLSYLSRNESGSYILLLIILFLIKKDYKENFKYLLLGIMVFLIVISWWEIRNFLIFGKYTNQMKRNLLLCNEFFDFLCFDKVWTIKEWLSAGVANVVIRKFASLHYKIDLFVLTIHWLITLFFVFSIKYNIKNVLQQIMILYLLLTYLLVGILFSFTQRGGWHAPHNLLPFIILFAIDGVTKFVESFNTNRKQIYTCLVLLLMFFYFVGRNIKLYKDVISMGKRDLYKEVSYDITKHFAEQKITSPKIMVNDAHIVHYYTDYNTIQIPFDKTIDSFKKAVLYYQPDYVILTGFYPHSTRQIYLQEVSYEWLELVYTKKYNFQIPTTDGNGGTELKIYKVNYDKL